jgi:hypothetical protein
VAATGPAPVAIAIARMPPELPRLFGDGFERAGATVRSLLDDGHAGPGFPGLRREVGPEGEARAARGPGAGEASAPDRAEQDAGQAQTLASPPPVPLFLRSGRLDDRDGRPSRDGEEEDEEDTPEDDLSRWRRRGQRVSIRGRSCAGQGAR